jgi:hypothetical protein
MNGYPDGASSLLAEAQEAIRENGYYFPSISRDECKRLAKLLRAEGVAVNHVAVGISHTEDVLYDQSRWTRDQLDEIARSEG